VLAAVERKPKDDWLENFSKLQVNV